MAGIYPIKTLYIIIQTKIIQLHRPASSPSIHISIALLQRRTVHRVLTEDDMPKVLKHPTTRIILERCISQEL